MKPFMFFTEAASKSTQCGYFAKVTLYMVCQIVDVSPSVKWAASPSRGSWLLAYTTCKGTFSMRSSWFTKNSFGLSLYHTFKTPPSRKFNASVYSLPFLAPFKLYMMTRLASALESVVIPSLSRFTIIGVSPAATTFTVFSNAAVLVNGRMMKPKLRIAALARSCTNGAPWPQLLPPRPVTLASRWR